MATLTLKITPERTITLTKSVTSIGRGPQNDIRLDNGSVEDRHAHVLKDRNGYRIFASEGAKITINGKKKKEWSLSDGDEIMLGTIPVLYRVADPMSAEEKTDPLGRSFADLKRQLGTATDEIRTPLPRGPTTGSVPLEAFKKLYHFSAKIHHSPTLDALKRNLVDAVIDLANADTGYLIITPDDETVHFELGRDRDQNDLPREEARLSDSIVLDVIKTRKPVLISDALEDSIFSDSRSVVNYKLRSVIAVPILLGQEILGVLYLGCDRKPSAFTDDYFDILEVFASQAGLLVKNAMLVDRLREDNQALKLELEKRTFGEIVGGSASMQGIFKAIARFAPTDISVMISGETGTGKELIAREIHRRSTRAEGPFIAINMSAIPESLLEAELFGHVRGAFTGAISDRRGKFAEANGGTLFLDEIGDMPLPLQSKLLRVVQERTVVRVGSNASEPIDIRFVAASNRDLQVMQDEGSFRPDLFYRLNEVTVALPPLSDRDDDIILLGTYFLSKYAEQMGRRVRQFTPKATAAMKRYRWPGNVRELEAKIKKAVVMSDGAAIDLVDLEFTESGMAEILPLKEAKEAYALRYIQEVLELNNGNRSKTARDLGIDPRTVYKYLEGK